MVNQEQRFERSTSGVAQPWLSAPFGIYRVSDGAVAMAMGSLTALGEAIGADLSGFDAWEDRDDARRAVENAVAGWSADRLVADVLDAGLWSARVRDMEEAVDELRATGSPMIVEVDAPGIGRVELIGNPVTLSETPWSVRIAPPTVGQHTDEVLAEIADIGRIAELRTSGAIG